MTVVHARSIYADGNAEPVRFSLGKVFMLEKGTSLKWAARRSAIKDAIRRKGLYVQVGIKTRFASFSCESQYPFVSNGHSVQIGCMRFTGENAKKLRKWATA